MVSEKDARGPINEIVSANDRAPEAHSMVDIAAAIVEWELKGTGLDQGASHLYDALYEAADRLGLSVAFCDGMGEVRIGFYDVVQFGARLGYSLALTEASARYGWGAWLEAARTELAAVGCDPAAHWQAAVHGFITQAAQVKGESRNS